ncbi:uncharacterized protein [Gossypium hirsutum]|uniref:Tf2-1-like SH3-like domain-containing protein n=1 Tax=Gossypium hirsutum TaxID=3635 RepID=A0ABM3A1A9_GOSHI|nr:uncharacterized protein LOC121217196 [Gossypium hirsutum]
MARIEYQVGEYVFLKVSPWKKVLRFGRKGKLSPRFIGTCEVVERIGPIAYQLKLPFELDRIHDVFHVYIVRNYRVDPSHVVSAYGIEVQPDLTYEEEPMKVVAREVKVLQNKKIDLVKVLWVNILEDCMEPLVQAMIGAFQEAIVANTASANCGLPLECLQALGGEE